MNWKESKKDAWEPYKDRYEHEYQTLLELSGLKTLKERRETNFIKFARKTKEWKI